MREKGKFVQVYFYSVVFIFCMAILLSVGLDDILRSLPKDNLNPHNVPAEMFCSKNIIPTLAPLWVVSFICLQKVTTERIPNDATVENQDEDKASSVPAENSCLKRLKSIIFKEKEVELKITTENVMKLLQPVRYKPSSIEEISKETKFTKSEVKFLYRSFKQECPNGIID